jgi:hypothetical protein
VRPGGDAADRFAVSLLAARAAAALSPLPAALRCGTRTAGTAAPAHRTALTLRLTALVAGELARLLALLTRNELLLRTERRRAELRTRCELRTRSVEGRSRRTEAGAATAAATAAPPATRAVLIAELRGRRSRFVRTRRWARASVACGFARRLVAALPRRLVIGAV